MTGILAGFDPIEICLVARVNGTFWRAAAADFIWEEKLPENYAFLMERVLGEDELRKGFGGKIGIYSRLCRRNLFDGGKKEFWLDKQSGGVCMSISSKALSITGIDDRRYWNYIPTEESRNSGWSNKVVGFACQSLLRLCQLLELMTEDTGITFLPRNLAITNGFIKKLCGRILPELSIFPCIIEKSKLLKVDLAVITNGRC